MLISKSSRDAIPGGASIRNVLTETLHEHVAGYEDLIERAQNLFHSKNHAFSHLNHAGAQS